MICPRCQTETSGAYCQECGAPADGAACKGCGDPLPAGANYCTGCGDPVREKKVSTPWAIATIATLALAIVLLVPTIRGGGSPGVGSFGGDALSPEMGFERAAPLTGTPREQADRLFNRVMQALAAGDLEQVNFFAPMGILAYRQAGELDDDGLYHLSLLETVGGDPSSGLETAERILEGSKDHLLALAAAAQAADALGDRDRATRYYEHFLAVYEAESERPLPEYLDHAQILEPYRAEAEAYLSGSE